MNEDAARRAVKAFLDDNASTFMSGLTIAGATMGSPHVARSDFAMPVGVETESPYPFIQVSCRRVRLANRTPGGNTLSIVGRYDMEVRIMSLGIEDSSDTTAYETSDANFRTMCDWIANNILTTARFTSGNDTFALLEADSNSIVVKENVDKWLKRKGGTVAALILGARINFTIEDC